MNQKLIQIEDKSDSKDPKFQKEKLKKLVECATTVDENGKETFDKQRFADLIVGECVAAVLLAEVSMSNYMASVIETRLGYNPKHFNDQWFVDNWLIEKK